MKSRKNKIKNLKINLDIIFYIINNMRVPIEDAFKGGESDPRNPILHQMFSYLGYGERAGSGLFNIGTIWKEKDWKEPKLEERLNPSKTTLILSTEKNSTINSTINKIRNKYPELKEIYINIIKLMLDDKYITKDKIANKLGKSRNAVSRNIKTLKEFNIIYRVGSNKDGYWDIKC